MAKVDTVSKLEEMIVQGDEAALQALAKPAPHPPSPVKGLVPNEIAPGDSLYDIFRGIPEFADERGLKYDQVNLLCLLALGMLMGGNDVRNILKKLGLHEEAVLKLFGMERLPSEATLLRRIEEIRTEDMREALRVQGAKLNAAVALDQGTGEVIYVIDGKALRATARASLGENTGYITNVIDAATSLCIGAHFVEAKTSERAVAPKLLKALNLEGAIVTGDAHMTDDPIRTAVLEGGGDYVFPVKHNNRKIRREMEAVFNEVFDVERVKGEVGATLPDGVVVNTWYEEGEYLTKIEMERAHGRWEIREYHLLTNLKRTDLSRLNGLKSIGYVVRRRIYPVRKRNKAVTEGTGKNKGVEYRTLGDAPGRKMEYRESVQRLPYMLSYLPTIDEFARHVRIEWNIENKLHYRLDEVLKEDRVTYRSDTVRENMAILHRMVYNLLVVYESGGRSGTETMRGKRMRLAVNFMDAAQLVVGSMQTDWAVDVLGVESAERIRMEMESLGIPVDGPYLDVLLEGIKNHLRNPQTDNST